jgi:hypothetical protein
MASTATATARRRGGKGQAGQLETSLFAHVAVMVSPAAAKLQLTCQCQSLAATECSVLQCNAHSMLTGSCVMRLQQDSAYFIAVTAHSMLTWRCHVLAATHSVTAFTAIQMHTADADLAG